MEPRFYKQVGKYQVQTQRRRRWYHIVTALSCVVVFCTTYALILPAITMERPQVLDCPLTVHAHTADCYDETGALACGQADFVVHTHASACYDAHGQLVCPLPELEVHTHTDACYTAQAALTCGLEETAGHQHTGDCYASGQGAPVCGSEDAEHVHTEDCYEPLPLAACGLEETAGHFHSAHCYTEEALLVCGEDEGPAPGGETRLLTCGLEEAPGHAHNDGCYTVETALTCGSEDEAHVHNGGCYEQTARLSCGLPETPGHAHGGDCYTVEAAPDSGEAHIHTDDCYERAARLTCGLEQGEGAHTHTSDCYRLTCGLEQGEGAHHHTRAACYAADLPPSCGREEISLHRHTAACYDESGALACGQLEVLEHIHGDDCFHFPETAFQTYRCEDDALAAEVRLPADSGVPADAVLMVRPITAVDQDYAALVRQAEASVDRAVTEIALYDISFRTPDGAYIPVADTATVSLRFKETLLQEGTNEVAVLHYPEDADLPVALEDVDVACGQDDAVSVLTFQTDGFSVFGVALLADTDQTTSNSFTLTYNGYTITFLIVDDSGNPIDSNYSARNIDANGATRYIFGAKDSGTPETDPVVEKIAPVIPGYAYVGATRVTGQTATDGYKSWGEIASVGTNGYSGTFGEATTGFRFYTTEPLTSGGFLSWGYGNYTVTLTYHRHTQDYSGTWAIVNQQNGTAGVAMMAGGVDSTGNRAGKAVNLVQLDGSCYVRDGDVTQWTFEKQQNGTYHIYTPVGDGSAKQYLNIGTYGGPVTLRDDPQDIYVDEGSGFYPGVHLYVVGEDGYEDEVNLFYGSADSGFGSYGDGSRNSYQTLCKVMTGDYLYYNLNTPSMDNKGTGWKTAPSLDSTMQMIEGDDAALYAQPAGFTAEAGPAGMENLYRFNIKNTDYEGKDQKAAGLLEDEALSQAFKEAWYGEERFDGWTYTVGGTTYLFDPETLVTRSNDGTMQAAASKTIVTNADKTETIQPLDEETLVTLPSGATLTGHWTEISNVVTFFVNYKGTILDTEGDVAGRRTDTFTRSPAVGRVFYGKQTVGVDNTFATAANQEITSYFSPGFDPDNPNPQIVIAYLRTCTQSPTTGDDYETAMNTPAPGANSAMVEANTLKLLKDTGRTVQMATGEGNEPTIDNSLCDSDHYQVRWYVMKEQDDTWHIDGVLVAKTAEMIVTKTFSGLTEQQVSDLLGKESNGYQIPVKLGENQNYLTMTTQSLPGQYEYTGAPTPGMQSYRWTLHAITDEKYDLSEENYSLDGYNVATQVVHYYKDADGNITYDYASGDTTSVLADSNVIGGTTSAVSFNNFYTPTGTGLLSLAKRAEGSATALQGAEFTLYDKDDKNEKEPIATATSNANGAVYFSGLKKGTYWLKETTPPAGYEQYEGYWKVKVKEGKDSVTVTIQAYAKNKEDEVDEKATTCYDSSANEIYTYPIYNDPEDDTITIVKEFSGLTNKQMKDLSKDSKESNKKEACYYIDLTGTGTDGDTTKELYLSDATHDQTGLVYTWTLTGVDIGANWTLTEHNYLMQGEYADTVVSVIRSRDKRTMVNGVTTSEHSSESLEAALNYTANTAAVSFQFHADDSAEGIDYSNRTITVTNHYTNTFDLKLRKVDSATNAPLKDASFKVYGPYDQAENSTDFITYRGRRYYYIGTTNPSDTDGYTTWPGLSLSQSKDTTSEDTTFVYYLSEWQSPEGYVKLDTPLAASVTVGMDDPNYSGGVLTMNAPNTKEKDYVHPALDTPKLWSPYTPTDATVTLELYRVTHTKRGEALDATVDAELVAEITLDGNAEEKPNGPQTVGSAGDYPIMVYESAPWVATWMNLYSASKDYAEDHPEHYHYFIREVSATNAGGFVTTYACLDAEGNPPDGALQNLKVTMDNGRTETFQGVLLADMGEAYTVTVTNTAYFELPESGGPGTLPYTIGGALLAAASLLYGYGLRRRRERGSTR